MKKTIAIFSLLALPVLASFVSKISFSNPEPKWDVRADSDRLRRHVSNLSSIQPARNFENLPSLDKAAGLIKQNWEGLGLSVEEQAFKVDGKTYKNLIVHLGPEKPARVIIGAHYDVCGDQPGADDNASGVAVLLELSRLLIQNKVPLDKGIDLVAYTLEEPPYFETQFMGSAIHAKSLAAKGVEVSAMISLEMLGYFDNRAGSQGYPHPFFKLFYPDRGDFIALVGSLGEWSAVATFKEGIQQNSDFPVQSFVGPKWIEGMDYSDHLNYWEEGFRAFMITDTAFLRNPNYHQPTDTPDTLNYKKMAEATDAILGGVARLLSQH